MDPMRKRHVIIAVSALVVIGLIVAGWALSRQRGPAIVDDVPKVDTPVTVTNGMTLTLPNTDREGKPMPVPRYESDPEDKAAVLNVPLVEGPCQIEPDGSIGAPDDYTTACLFNHARGGQAILSHSVRGPRTGVFDRLAEVAVGSEVTIEGRHYKVARVDIFPADAIPEYVWEKGRLSLITCTLQPKHDDDPKAPWTHTTVVSLTEA